MLGNGIWRLGLTFRRRWRFHVYIMPHQFIQGHPVQAAELQQVLCGGDRTAHLPPGDGLAGYVETLRHIQLGVSVLFSKRR